MRLFSLRFPWAKSGRSRFLGLLSMTSALLSATLTMTVAPARSAERLYISYGVLERSISFDVLEAYAKQGTLSDDLYVYTQYVKDDQELALRQVLQAKADLSPVAVSQFLYTSQGEILLKRLGEIIQPESRLPGEKAIRAALILAAGHPDGLTPLNVFRQFPTKGIRIDLQKSLAIADQLSELITRTNQISKEIARQADADAASQPLDPKGLPDLSIRGRFRWDKRPLTLSDPKRASPTSSARIFPADLYYPLNAPKGRGGIPLIVISHGLGSDRRTFIYLAEHLASHGFAVAVVEHLGSNSRQMKALIVGAASEATTPSEFVDRPLDIKFLLDELTRRAAGDPALAAINLQQVGVLGQSFGGYTALALAGAPINFNRLQEKCTPAAQVSTFNLSLLLQCQAGVLPVKDYNLADGRVRSVLAINPVDSTIFGPESLMQVTVPTLIIAGNADTVAPAVSEQIRPFTWLPGPEKYLALVDRSTHFSFLNDPPGQPGEQLPIPPELAGPDPAVTRRYIRALSVAFFRTHLVGQSSYRPYLSAAYGRFLSQDPLRLDLITSLELPKKLEK
jgi:predicted dienelactone hydrolase